MKEGGSVTNFGKIASWRRTVGRVKLLKDVSVIRLRFLHHTLVTFCSSFTIGFRGRMSE